MCGVNFLGICFWESKMFKYIVRCMFLFVIGLITGDYGSKGGFKVMDINIGIAAWTVLILFVLGVFFLIYYLVNRRYLKDLKKMRIEDGEKKQPIFSKVEYKTFLTLIFVGLTLISIGLILVLCGNESAFLCGEWFIFVGNPMFSFGLIVFIFKYFWRKLEI